MQKSLVCAVPWLAMGDWMRFGPSICADGGRGGIEPPAWFPAKVKYFYIFIFPGIATSLYACQW